MILQHRVQLRKILVQIPSHGAAFLHDDRHAAAPPVRKQPEPRTHNAAEQVELQKTPLPKDLLHAAAKQPQAVHVEQQMHEAAVGELVCDQPPKLKMAHIPWMEQQQIRQMAVRQHVQQKHRHVGEYQCFHHRPVRIQPAQRPAFLPRSHVVSVKYHSFIPLFSSLPIFFTINIIQFSPKT